MHKLSEAPELVQLRLRLRSAYGRGIIDEEHLKFALTQLEDFRNFLAAAQVNAQVSNKQLPLFEEK